MLKGGWITESGPTKTGTSNFNFYRYFDQLIRDIEDIQDFFLWKQDLHL